MVSIISHYKLVESRHDPEYSNIPDHTFESFIKVVKELVLIAKKVHIREPSSIWTVEVVVVAKISIELIKVLADEGYIEKEHASPRREFQLHAKPKKVTAEIDYSLSTKELAKRPKTGTSKWSRVSTRDERY